MDLADKIIRRADQLEALRQPHIGDWQEVFHYMAPERAKGWFDGAYVGQVSASKQPWARRDSTARNSMEVLKSAIASGLTPENSRWFALDAGLDDEESVRWLDDAAQFMFERMNAAGFSAVSNECLGDLLPAGWFVMYVDEARDARGEVIGGFNFEAWPIHQCCVASSRPGGRVDTVYRRFYPTVEQLAAEYGLDKCSEGVRKQYAAGKLSEPVEVLWAIEPQRDGDGVLAKNKPFRSVHLERSGKHILRESGYDEFPCAVPRWRLLPGTAYGTGIGFDVLDDTITINRLKELELLGLDIAVGGMWKVTDDGVINPKTVKLGPRKLVVVGDINNMQRLESGARFDVAFSKEDRLRESIRMGLLADLLTPSNGPVRSATEIQQRTNQMRQVLGPIMGRMQQEYLQMVIERCFNIAFRAGALVAACGPVPRALAEDGRFDVRYLSPLARSQKMEEVVAIDSFVAGLLEFAGATQQFTALDAIKLDDAMYDKGLALGVPAKFLRGPKELAKKRQMDNEAAEAAKAQASQEQLQMQAGAAAIESATAA
jgi:hypothetical protein